MHKDIDSGTTTPATIFTPEPTRHLFGSKPLPWMGALTIAMMLALAPTLGCGGCTEDPTCEGEDCPCEGEDCPCVGEDCPCVGEDCPCVGEDCPCVGEDCPCVGEDCPCVGEDCPCVGEDCPCVGEDCPCVGEDCDPDCEDPPIPGPDYTVIECGNLLPEVVDARCDTTAGAGTYVLIQGSVLAGTTVYQDGGVLIDQATGRITCTGCDCAAEPEAANATTISCPDSVISPGLINAHDHITWALWSPAGPNDPNHRYDHRHDWRTGARENPEINYPSARNTRNAVLYGELRMLLGGATSIAGSISSIDASGLLRNLDSATYNEGLTGVNVDYRTFPLGDIQGQMRTGGDCSYPSLDNPNRINNPIYMPHVAEGIDAEAQNEFHCLSTEDGIPMLAHNTSLVHAIGLTPQDIARVAMAGAKVIWSPRSNISLYGHTTPVTVYHGMGVTVSLGTDWTISGSMNMLRELECADYYNREFLRGYFTDRELWEMATSAAAVSMGSETHIGRLEAGMFADVSIFEALGKEPYRAVLEADIDEVVLVLRAGEPLYGDSALIEALVPVAEIGGCEPAEICGISRRICLQRDAAVTLATLQAEHASPYPLYFCDGTPLNEPTCHPSRPAEFTGVPGDVEGDSIGDGIPDAEDLCPGMFSPTRPVEGGLQADFDDDGIGDFCDPCALTPDVCCWAVDPDDLSGDGIPNDEDVCPFHYNPDQVDTSGDGYGDVCSPCPEQYAPDGVCSLTIQAARDVFNPEHISGSVRVEGLVVTALASNGFFIQDPLATEPDFSAAYVYTDVAPTVAMGDLVEVTGSLGYYYGHAQFSRPQVVVTGTAQLPAPFVIDPAEIATPNGGGEIERLRTLRYQSALYKVENVEITQANADEGSGDYGEFRVTGGLRVDDMIYRYTQPTDIRVLGAQFTSITGVLHYSFSNTKLLPRSAADMVFAN